MSDIIERLRLAQLSHDELRFGWLAEAVDEIKRLRAENELHAQRLKDSHDIVARIWKLFGNPSYADLKGKSIDDLITDLQAENGQLGARVAALVKDVADARAPLFARVAELEAELLEQSLLHGMGSEREARLFARVAELERAQDDEVLASVSSDSAARREWCSGSAWLYPGDRIVVIRSPRLSPPKAWT